jgi:hypothetical protein
MRKNAYPRRRKGVKDPNQMLQEFVYLNAVKSIVESNPTGLNTGQIAEKLPEHRQKIIDLLKAHPSRVPTHWSLENLPDAGKSRKTVRKYLKELLKFRNVKKVGIAYYPSEQISSDELIQAVDKLLASPDHQDWQLGQNLAIYRTYIHPKEYRNRIDDFFDSHIPRFANSLFFLDQILEDAIGSKQMSSRIFTEGKGINYELLRTGWERYFGSTKLFILAYAVSPPELLKFLETKDGSQLGKRILAERWSDILRGAVRKQKILESHERTREYRKRQSEEEKI